MFFIQGTLDTEAEKSEQKQCATTIDALVSIANALPESFNPTLPYLPQDKNTI